MIRSGQLRKTVLVIFFGILMLSANAYCQCTKTYGTGSNKLVLAGGSPGELGLIEALSASFTKRYDATICWQKAGSGKSLALLKEKKVDAVLVHAPAAEKKAVKAGWAIKRSLIASNEFYIVGPKKDPAGIKDAKNASHAFARIAKAKARFISRGDNSGTHKKEQAIWKKAGITPGGKWYILTKQFMMASLKKANEVNGYFMTDSSTWVAAKKDLTKIKVQFKSDPMLINTYHGLCQPKGATKNQKIASRFIDFLESIKGQEIIREYGKNRYGEAMYNDAKYAGRYN